MGEMSLERACEVLTRRLHKGLHWHAMDGRAVGVPLDGPEKRGPDAAREAWDGIDRRRSYLNPESAGGRYAVLLPEAPR